MILVGELSKFPLPFDNSRGKCFASFAQRAPAFQKQRDPRASWVLVERQVQTSLPLKRCRDWSLRSWLHKHPHPSTCPRLPSPWSLPLILANLRARLPKLVAPFACYPQSKLEAGKLRLRVLDSLAPRLLKPWGSGASTLPLRAKLSGTVFLGQKGISGQQPAA